MFSLHGDDSPVYCQVVCAAKLCMCEADLVGICSTCTGQG